MEIILSGPFTLQLFYLQIHVGAEHEKLHSKRNKHYCRLFISQCYTVPTPLHHGYVQLCVNACNRIILKTLSTSIPVILLLFLLQQQYRYLQNLLHTPIT